MSDKSQSDAQFVLEEPISPRAQQIGMITLAAVAALGIFWYLHTNNPITVAKASVSEGLLDPDSAKFRDVQRCHHDKSVIVGHVSAKNAYGAYVGFEPFFHSGHHTVFPGKVPPETARDWMARCYSPEIVKRSEDSFPMPLAD